MEITLKYYRLDMPKGDEVLRSSLKRFQSAFVADVKKSAIQAAADYLYATGQIPRPFDVGSLF